MQTQILDLEKKNAGLRQDAIDVEEARISESEELREDYRILHLSLQNLRVSHGREEDFELKPATSQHVQALAIQKGAAMASASPLGRSRAGGNRQL